jgi:hypothetical protein
MRRASPDRRHHHGRTRRWLVLFAAIAAATAAPLAQRTTNGAPVAVVLTGALADGGAQPLAHYPVQACLATTCYFGETSSDGRFRFELRVAVPARLAIKTLEVTDSLPRRASALAPVIVSGAGTLDAGKVHVPDLPGGPAALTGRTQIVEAGDGLSLVLDAGALTPPAGRAMTGVAARRLPPSQVPRYALPDGERVLAVYVFTPFGTTSRSPMGVRVAANLDAGSRVRFRTISDLDGSFSAPFDGSATGTHLVTDPGTGISALTHLVVTR